MKITFDFSAFTAADAGDTLYATFAAQSCQMKIGKPPASKEKKKTWESINFDNNIITYDKDTPASYGTSKAYTLSYIQTNGLVLESATSLVCFISYGGTKGIEKLPVGSQPAFLASSTDRYSIFEISYSADNPGGADITNISQFGGSIKIAFIDDEGNEQSHVENTADTTTLFKALAATSGSSADAVVLDQNGKFKRIIGTNVFPNGTTNTPYPTFNAYLEAIYSATDKGTKSAATITNLDSGQPNGGTGSYGITSTSSATKVTASTLYNVDYHFDVYVTKVSPPLLGSADPDTYSVQLKGNVVATEATDSSSSYTYDSLEIDISADELATGKWYMTNFIYMASTVGPGIVNVTLTGFSDLNNDFGDATVTGNITNKAAGDFAEGMTSGMVNSSTPLDNSKDAATLGSLPSSSWWSYNSKAYGAAQTANPYYSTYGNVISENSGGSNNGQSFSRGGVYGAPYDDRFDLNLIAPDSNTAEFKITLLADGDLTPS